MAVFRSTSLNAPGYSRLLKRYPALFGVPFVLIVVGASFAMQNFTQTKYDLQSQKVSAMTKEQELRLAQDRKKFDIREEYFKLNATAEHDWEPKRIQRPKGLPEWGVPPPEPPADPKKSP
ncbi:cytochrome c oxidase assembly protein COX16-domain-containing protein [Epithele typhae]|uniref:cytochrome c oxidase assembly protein COX16-domain-containing protein n=1 Tax=Epithele typhae TaxID=378194 RepID=UPI0020080504|nr:cytochrome c oxidase assembly protein COX16-domain-containing protein [Epithele typhae]KAH9928464.1 cytochrome c oxidase assembly protein COX16-domain-containing protein [Epithele typhae]